MKRQINDMFQVWLGVLADCQAVYPDSHVEWRRDCDAVRRGVQSRGLGFFSLDLPTLDNHLLTLLEFGSVDFSGPLTGRKSKTDVRPRFLWALWTRVCDTNGCLLKEPDPFAIAALRQLSCLWKKFEVACSSDRIAAAGKEYFDIEKEVLLGSLPWSDDRIDPSSAPTFAKNFEHVQDAGFPAFLQRLDIVAGILISELGFFDAMSEDSPETGFFKHGPGAVSNRKGKEYKYSFPYWSDKLEGVFPFDWCSGAPLGSYPASKQERPSKLFSVPKTAKAPRLIASEPVEHQWCQQKVATWLDNAIQRSLLGRFINLHDQALSQRLVVLAAHDRSLSTIDLSSASDRVSCRHVESLMRVNPPLLEATHAVRTRWIDDRLTFTGFHKLRKFAAMGSALTFPVQSIFFLVVALASCDAASRRDILALQGKVRTFGDDIIVPRRWYTTVVKNLTALGLKVNEKKSFSNGHFRESCGRDQWRDSDVTPLKPQSLRSDSPTHLSSMIDSCNNLHLKGWWFASRAVYRQIPSWARRSLVQVPREGTVGDPGIHTFGSPRFSRKWDPELHRWYYRAFNPKSSNERIQTDGSEMMREFLTRPYSGFHPRESGIPRTAAAIYAFARVGCSA